MNIQEYYDSKSFEIDNAWDEHISCNQFDNFNFNKEILFWEFVENLYYKEQENNLKKLTQKRKTVV